MFTKFCGSELSATRVITKKKLISTLTTSFLFHSYILLGRNVFLFCSKDFALTLWPITNGPPCIESFVETNMYIYARLSLITLKLYQFLFLFCAIGCLRV